MDDSATCASCDTCGNELHTIVRHDGKRSLECPECGPGGEHQPDTPNELVADFSGNQFAHDTNNATSTGHRGNHTGPTKARKVALTLIDRLCGKLIISEDIKGQIKKKFNETASKGSQSYAAHACAALLSIAHLHKVPITLTNVASITNIKPEEILKAQEKLEEFMSTAEKEATREGAVLGVGGIPFPQFNVNHPVSGVTITQKVKDMAAEIIRVVQELPTDELNPTFAPIAAACLAYQSFYFHEGNPKGDKRIELKKFVENVGMTENLKPISKSFSTIQKALMLLGDRMLDDGILKKVPKSESDKRFVPRNLLEILKHKKKFVPLVLKEVNNKREQELTYEDDSVSEEEFTKEDQEKLMTMELGEEDLSDGEFESMKLLPDAQAFIAEHVLRVMEKYEEERASKKRKRTKQGNVESHGQDDEMEEVDSDDDGSYEEENFEY